MSDPQYGSFDGYDATISDRAEGGSTIYYGGSGDHGNGSGHGHVAVNDGDSVEYWREPGSKSAAINDHAPEGKHTFW